MKKTSFYLLTFVLAVVIATPVFHSCKKDDPEITTSMAIDKTETEYLNIGDVVTATISVVAEDVTSLTYTKIVDNVYGDPVDVTNSITVVGDTSKYTFSYTLEDGDDLHTLGFEFEAVDHKNVSYTVALVVHTNLSIKSSFVKYDWHINAELWLGMSVLTEADSVKTFRFSDDGTYEVDLTAQYAASTHHFCYWVYQETPSNGDTIAVLRLIRKMKSDDTAVDEYYDFRITAASESEMTMYWDIAVFGLFDIQRTFVSKPKGAFQAYGTAEMETEVNGIAAMDCGTVDNGLFTID